MQLCFLFRCYYAPLKIDNRESPTARGPGDWRINEGDSGKSRIWESSARSSLSDINLLNPPRTKRSVRSCALYPSRSPSSAVQSTTAAVTHPGTAAATPVAATPAATNGAVATPMKFSTNFSRMPVQR